MSPTTAATIRRALQHLVVPDNKSSRPPSQRAQEIYRRVTIDCEPQKDIARELKISPSRISQIVSHVRRWLAQGSQSTDNSLTHSECRRLELALAKARHEGLYERSIRAYDHQQAHPTATTTRTESKPLSSRHTPCAVPAATPHSAIRTPQSDQSEICNLKSEIAAATPHSALPTPHSDSPQPETRNLEPETLSVTKVVSTSRPLPPAVQLLKTAQRSATELLRLAERDAQRGQTPDVQPHHDVLDADDLFDALKDILSHFRHRAEQEGRVPKSSNPYQLLDNLLSAFLGIDQGSGGGFLFLDDAVHHFAKTFLLPTVNAYPPVTEPQQLLTDLLTNHEKIVSSPQLETGAPAIVGHLEPETASPTANCPLPTAPSQPETCNLEPETCFPVTCPQLDPHSSPPNPAPTPSLPTPSVPQPKKQISSPAHPHTLTPSHSRTPLSHPSHFRTSPQSPIPNLQSEICNLKSFNLHYPASPNHPLHLALHPWSRPS